MGPPGEESRAVLLEVDPITLHVYWEARPEPLAASRGRLGEETAPLVLRFRHLTLPPGEPETFDLDLEADRGNATLKLSAPGLRLRCELGVRGRDGRFAALARSNSVQLPPAGESEQYEERFRKLPEPVHERWKGGAGAKAGAGMPETVHAAEASVDVLSPEGPRVLAGARAAIDGRGHPGRAPRTYDPAPPVPGGGVPGGAVPVPPVPVPMGGAPLEFSAGPESPRPRFDPCPPPREGAAVLLGECPAPAHGGGGGGPGGPGGDHDDRGFVPGGAGAILGRLAEGATSPPGGFGYGYEGIESPPADVVSLELGAEVMVYGRARPGTVVFVSGLRVPVRVDGTFEVRFALPFSPGPSSLPPPHRGGIDGSDSLVDKGRVDKGRVDKGGR